MTEPRSLKTYLTEGWMLNIICDLGGDQPEDPLNLDMIFISSARFTLDSSSLGISSFSTDYWERQAHEDNLPISCTYVKCYGRCLSPFILYYVKVQFSPACSPPSNTLISVPEESTSWLFKSTCFRCAENCWREKAFSKKLDKVN